MENYLPKISKTPKIKRISISSSPDEIFSSFSEEKNTSFLHSSLKTDSGRYSFIGIYPFLTMKTLGEELTLDLDGHKIPLNKDPFEGIRSIFETYKINNPTDLPFVGGGVGYFSYDLKNVLEQLPRTAENDLDLPEVYFAFYQAIIIFDNEDPHHAHISAIDVALTGRLAALELIEKIKQKLDTFKQEHPAPCTLHPASEISSNFTKEQYILAVEKIIDYIKAGDIYQACLSQRFKSKWTDDPYSLYQKLNKISPAPFSGYLNFDEAKIISSSPERFLLSCGEFLETRPMKGTRPRGKTSLEDKELKKSLALSKKDAAELSMIVDLERNDIGKVSLAGSVEVSEHRRIETYPTVHQTISIVKSKLSTDHGLIDAVKAAFPGGSISGCPKIRAMEIIDELEPHARSVYTGSMGYISFHNTMDLNIAIRTMILKNKTVYFQAGGGITAASDPVEEYEETLHKARALIESLS